MRQSSALPRSVPDPPTPSIAICFRFSKIISEFGGESEISLLVISFVASRAANLPASGRRSEHVYGKTLTQFLRRKSDAEDERKWKEKFGKTFRWHSDFELMFVYVI